MTDRADQAASGTPSTAAPGEGGAARIRCGFCGYEVTELLAVGVATCPECGSELSENTIARDEERPPAASHPLGMLLLLATGAGLGIGVAYLPFLLARFSLGNAPVGLVLAISLNACWWFILAPLFALAWADNFIRAFRLRRRLLLGGLAPVYLGIPVFIVLLAAAYPVAWPVLRPWIVGAPQGVSGPTAAPSALQQSLPTGPTTPPQPLAPSPVPVEDEP